MICISVHMLMTNTIIRQVCLLFVFSFSFKSSPTSLLYKIDMQIEHAHLSAITYLNGSSSLVRTVKNCDLHLSMFHQKLFLKCMLHVYAFPSHFHQSSAFYILSHHRTIVHHAYYKKKDSSYYNEDQSGL